MRKNKTLKDFPEILKLWDFEKNGTIDPLFVHSRSQKKFFWKCSQCGQSYLKSPDKMTTRTYRCPICSERIVVTGLNDICTTMSKQMLDWDYTKNNKLNPKNISRISRQKVWWKCHKCGHEWESSIYGSSKKKVNCPLCAIKYRASKRHDYELSKNGCLKDKKLLLDWDYDKNPFLPTEVTPKSNVSVHWKCHICGHEWQARINNRSNARGCPCCGRRVLVPGKNDLETINPCLAKEWHPTKNGSLKPNMVFPSQNKKVWWKCPAGHEYQATINHRSSTSGTNCPLCNSGRQTSFREQALYFYIKQLFSDAISRYKPSHFGKFELDIYIPSIKYAIEYDGIAWHKKDKLEREQRKYLMCRENNIKLIRIKEDASELFNIKIADKIITGSDFETEKGFKEVIVSVIKYISCFLTDGYSELDIDLSRDRFEIMKYASVLKNSFADEYPDKAKEWHPTKNGVLKPTMFKQGSNFKAWWLCPECGNEYEQTINHHIHGGGCPKCVLKYRGITRRMNIIKKNGSISNPILLNEWNYDKNGDSTPDCFTNGSDEKVWWKCHICGHEWQERISNRNHGRGCPKCANRKLFRGYNDFATMHPELLNEWNYERNNRLLPQDIHYKSVKKVWWKCPKCGYEYQAPPVRRSLGSGCRKCADKENSRRAHERKKEI